jgi:L-threonylcarbamoyladenylate synthase
MPCPYKSKTVKILKINPQDIDQQLIIQAAGIIKNGGLVAFPTETVYGLGANALDPDAVIKIFEAKKRPLDDPLIVHISGKEQLHEIVRDIPHCAQQLIERFWPGPLTIIFKKSDIVPDLVTTGLDTVAVRMPANEIATELIRQAGVPIAAPSANLFGRPSPTKSEHVLEDLSGAIDCIIDGGQSTIGVESTVVEVHEEQLLVLRPGGITIEELSSIVDNVYVYDEKEIIEKSPGKYPQHYSPKATVVISGNSPEQVGDTVSLARKFISERKKIGIIARTEHIAAYEEFYAKALGAGNDGHECAENLFSLLRELDAAGVDIIIAEAIEEAGLGLAVMNRLRKSSG